MVTMLTMSTLRSTLGLITLIASLALGCGGSSGTAAPPSGPTPTPPPAATPTPSPSDPLALLVVPEGLFGFDATQVSRDGRVVASALTDQQLFTYTDPFGVERIGAITCNRAYVWRDGLPAAPLDLDPGCPFPEPNDAAIWFGDSVPVALSGDGSIALVNRRIADESAFGASATFGLAHADGRWEELVWDAVHPDAPVTPNATANDMTPDASVVVGNGWIQYPYPGWSPSDSRAWRFRVGDDGPVWLAAPADRLESADLVSDDGNVVVGCCDDSDDDRRSLPVVWRGDEAPVTLPAPVTLSGIRAYCRANDVSGDGRIVVGRCDNVAVRWDDGVPSVIDVPSGEVPDGGTVAHQALHVSSDGATIFGNSFFSGGPPGGWVWTDATGIRSVHEMLEEAGIVVDDGVQNGRRLGAALAVSDDARVIVGFGESGIGDSHVSFLYRATLR